MSVNRTYFVIAVIAFLTTGCGDAALEPDAPVSRSSVDLSFLEPKQIFEPQVTFLEDGTLAVIWRERGEEGSNIYVAVRNADGHFGAPVRVNDDINTVQSYAHDGMRAAIAVGTGSTFAIAWADGRAQIRTATSADGGQSFQPSIRLDQSGKPAYRGYPAISFDSAGDLHAIWIDSRLAEGMAEEPADLFYAKVVNGIVAETNLTADQEPTICGCCR
ncbi:MAG: glycoside hydrolase, partial [Gammaproteobacteria bacterium]|nr:glycoside hydrolase [Gammaproteobacteria bacterium]